MRKLLLSLLLLIASVVNAQQPSTADTQLVIKQLPSEGVLLNKGWKFQTGDNPAYADPSYDDSKWESIDPTKDIHDLPQLWKGIGWFRLHVTVDSALAQQAIAVLVEQTGASEYYLNGQLLQRFGIISSIPERIVAVTPARGTYIGLPIKKSDEQVLAVRFAVQKPLPYMVFARRPNYALFLQLTDVNSTSRTFQVNINLLLDYLRGGLFLIMALLHLALFWFTPSQKANLYFFVYAVLFTFDSFLISLVYTHVYLIETKLYVLIGITLGSILGSLCFLSAVYEIYNRKMGLMYWFIFSGSFLSLLGFLNYHNGTFYILLIVAIVVFLECIRVTVLAIKEKRRGAGIIIVGAAGFVVFYSISSLSILGYIPVGPDGIYAHIGYNLATVMLPISVSIYLALEDSFINRSLQQKLAEVNELSQRNLAQEQEKQQILAAQKETLEQQVSARTAALNLSLEELKATQAQLVQREKMASLGELTAGIAHEIQNPLNFVNNFSEINTELLDELKQEAQTGNTSGVIQLADELKENELKIGSHGRRADAIVKGMLQHSRTNTGEKEPTDLNALVDEYLRLAYHGIRAKEKEFSCELETRFDPAAGIINMVPQDIGRVLLNLFNNAFYATAEKKTQLNGSYQPLVSVSTRRVNGAVEIQIRDNGTGIPKALQDKIFQPFFTTKPTGDGTGLGLSLSYDIITKGHGGELAVVSQEGEGTTFKVHLPC